MITIELKTKMTLNRILRFASYCVVNTLHLGYKEKSADVI
jgi:hypothetical protein